MKIGREFYGQVTSVEPGFVIIAYWRLCLQSGREDGRRNGSFEMLPPKSDLGVVLIVRMFSHVGLVDESGNAPAIIIRPDRTSVITFSQTRFRRCRSSITELCAPASNVLGSSRC